MGIFHWYYCLIDYFIRYSVYLGNDGWAWGVTYYYLNYFQFNCYSLHLKLRILFYLYLVIFIDFLITIFFQKYYYKKQTSNFIYFLWTLEVIHFPTQKVKMIKIKRMKMKVVLLLINYFNFINDYLLNYLYLRWRWKAC